MNTKFKLMFLGVMALLSSPVFAAGEVGKVVEIYTHPNGSVALRLDGGLPNSNAVNNCGTVENEWAGVDASAAASLKAAILLAKVTGSTVSLVTFGACVGNWIKIEAFHVR